MSEEPEDQVSRIAGGFNRTARDFDRAVSLAGLDCSHRILLDRAREESWGRPQMEGRHEPRPFRINLSELARLTGLSRENLGRRQRQMVAFRIFRVDDDGLHLINKDYRKWVDAKGSPRLSRMQVEWCLRVRRKARIVTQESHPLRPGSHTPLQSASPTCDLEVTAPVTCKSHPLRPGSHTPLQSEPERTPRADSGLTANSGVASIGTRAESFLEREREETNTPRAREGFEARVPGYDTTSAAERAELDAIGRAAADWFPTNDVIAKAILSRDGGYPVACYRAAAERLRIAPPSKRTRAYFLTIVADFERNGIPEAPAAPRESGPDRRQTAAERSAEKFAKQRATYQHLDTEVDDGSF